MMANYVIDATIVIEYLVTGIYTSNARALFKQVLSTERLIVPEFCLLECTNVIWKQVRFHGMRLQEAEALVKDLRKLPLIRVPVKRTLNQALQIGVAYELAVYDSAYIALAIHSRYPLITVDEKQRDSAIAQGVVFKPITDFQ